MGIAVLPKRKRFVGIHLLLLMVVLSSIFNIIESTHLQLFVIRVTPVFVIGFAPALYICAKYLIYGHQNWRVFFHFLAPVITLPFAHFVQEIIVIGTIFRFLYAVLTIMLVLRINKTLAQWRSDVADVSLTWFAGLVGLSTLINGLDLLRLNYQPELGPEANTALHALTSSLSVFILATIVIILTRKSHTFCNVITQSDATVSENSETESDYKALFNSINDAVKDNEWFCQPRLTLNDVAEKTGLQTRDISRAINLVNQSSFNDYINALRVDKVKSLLAVSPKCALLDIGLDAGFNSKASFNTVFKKHTQLTPSQYRRAMGVV